MEKIKFVIQAYEHFSITYMIQIYRSQIFLLKQIEGSDVSILVKVMMDQKL